MASVPARPVGRSTLYRRLFAAYVTILTVALAALLFAPVTVSIPVTVSELVVLLLGFLTMLGVFHLLLQRTLAPLERLTRTMERVDPLSPGRRIDVRGGATEVTALAEAFNEMLDRLERERRDSARRALNAQEDERQRIARELHDEVGQVLTGIVLRSETLLRRAPRELQTALGELREAARHGAEDVRGIATRLRPEALDELGLQSALLALCTAISTQSGITITRALERDLGLSAEQELVFYRVAQESITNVVRHARATRAAVTLRREPGGDVVLAVRDDGHGLGPSIPADAGGLRGMRERALLVGAELRISAVEPQGTEVQLRLPAGSGA
jgi:two-component system sensor histidine kinase UhpB